MSFYHLPMKKQVGIEEFGLLELSNKPFSLVCNRHFRVGNPTAMALENIRCTLDLHVLKCEALQDYTSYKQSSVTQLSSQLLTLNCTQRNFYQILSLSNAAIEAKACLYRSPEMSCSPQSALSLTTDELVRFNRQPADLATIHYTISVCTSV